MMKFHILTLFPEMVQHGLATSILGRAAEKNLISIDAVNIRDYTQDKHGKGKAEYQSAQGGSLGTQVAQKACERQSVPSLHQFTGRRLHSLRGHAAEVAYWAD